MSKEQKRYIKITVPKRINHEMSENAASVPLLSRQTARVMVQYF